MNTRLISLCLKAQRRRGFSLIEVALALGIVSFGFVSLLGILPVGLKVLASAKDMALETTIGQTLVAQVRQTSFSKLPQLAGGSPIYFDQEGKPNEQLSASNYVYQAVVTATYNSNVEVDGMAVATSSSLANVAAVTVTVTKVSNPAQPHLFCALVANNGL